MGSRVLVAVTLGLVALVGVAPTAVAQDDPYGGTTTTTADPSTRVSCSVSSSRARVGSTVGGHLSGTRPADRIRIFVGDELAAEVLPTGAETDFGFTVPDMQPGRYTVTAVGATATAECTVPGGGVHFQVLPRTGGRNDGGVAGAGAGAGGSTGVRSQGLALTGTEVLGLVVLGVGLVLAGLALRRRARLRRRRTRTA